MNVLSFSGGELSRSVSATWEQTSFPGGAPIAALNRQIQVLTNDLSGATALLDPASKNHRSELSAVSSELEASKAALLLSRSREAQAARERDKLEAELRAANEKCDILSQEHDQTNKMSGEDALRLAALEAEAGLRGDQNGCSISACQTDTDTRDAEIR